MSDEIDKRRGIRPTAANHFSGDTQAERIQYWAQAAREGALRLEERSRSGEPGDAFWAARPWIDGHIVDWWEPEVEHLKRTGQFGLALDLAWRCMEAMEEATFAHSVPLNTHWAREAAIVARKMRNFGLEVTICERVLDVDDFSQPIRDEWERRLVRAEKSVAKEAGHDEKPPRRP